MRGRGEADDPGAKAEVEEIVLPTPYVAEERALRKELERLNSTWTAGSMSVIAMPRSGGGWIYLAGRETMFTNFLERAYVLGTRDAWRLVGRYPAVLKGAEVIVG